MPLSIDADPIELFKEWFAEAEATEPRVPDAVAVATVDATGMPSVRMVLLKGVDPRGFVFYTNPASLKSQQLMANPQAAMNFHWKVLKWLDYLVDCSHHLVQEHRDNQLNHHHQKSKFQYK